MPDTTDLHIPDEAVKAADDAYTAQLLIQGPYAEGKEIAAAVRAAAPLVVAAELRRLAVFYEGVVTNRGNSRGVQTGNKAFGLVGRQLRARAAELDGGDTR